VPHELLVNLGTVAATDPRVNDNFCLTDREEFWPLFPFLTGCDNNHARPSYSIYAAFAEL